MRRWLFLLPFLWGCDHRASDPTPAARPPVSAVASTPPASSSATTRPAEWKLLADRWMAPQPIPNFELLNHRGESFRLRDIAAGHIFVGLIFTACSVPTACPLTTQKMFELGKLWKAAKAAGKTGDHELHLLTLTFDPENDTPEVLASYGALMLREIPDWTFATGPTELMETELPRIFGVLAEDHPKAGKAHNVKAALLGPGLFPLEEWKDNDFDPQEVIDAILK